MELAYNQVSACSVRQMGHLARDCPNRGTRDDSGINFKRALQGQTLDDAFVANSQPRDALPESSRRPVAACPSHQIRQRRQSLKWKSIQL